MQKYIFKNLDGLGADGLLSPFRMMLHEEGMRHSSIVNEESEYEWMIGKDVFDRIKAIMKTDYLPVTIAYDSSGVCTHRLMNIKIVVCSDLPRGCVILDKACPESNKKLVGDISNGYRYVDAATPRFTFSPHDFLNKTKEELLSKVAEYCDNDVIATNKMYNLNKMKEEINKMYGLNKMKANIMLTSSIVNVIYNDPATIVFWSDGTKTIVKCEGEAFDPEKGLAMAIAKYYIGTSVTKGDYYDIFRKWLPKQEAPESHDKKKDLPEEQLLTAKQLAEKTGKSISKIQKRCREGRYPGSMKVDGKWMIPYSGLVKDDLNGK